MNTNSKLVGLILVLAGWMFAVQNACSEVVYNNSSNRSDPEFFSQTTGYQFGDEIVLADANGYGYRFITNFVLEYYLTAADTNNQIRLRFYANDGPQYGTEGSTYAPGTLLYDSGNVWLTTSGSHTLAFNGTDDFGSDKGVMVPTNFTWTVTFNNIGVGESAGLAIYDPPTVGSSYDDYWEQTGSDPWSLRTNGQALNFGALAQAPVSASVTAVIKAPADKTRSYADSINVNGQALSPIGVALVSWRVGSKFYGTNSYTPIAGSNSPNWAVTGVPLRPGTNFFQIRVVNNNGNAATSTKQYIYVVTNQVTVIVQKPSAAGVADVDYNGQWLEINRDYWMKATPGANSIFTNWLASYDGGPTEVATNWNPTVNKFNTLRFRMQSNAVLTACFETNRFIKQDGLYYGLFFDEQTGGSGVVAHQSAGWFQIKVTSRQVFGGKMCLDGSAVGFSGSFNQQGVGTSKPIYRMKTGTTLGKSTMQLTLQLAFDGSDSVTGTLVCLSNTVYQPVGPFTSSLTGFKAAFYKTGGPLATNYTGTNWKGGTYTMAVDVPAGDGLPKGHTYGTVTLKTNGLALCVGNFGDYALFKPMVSYISKDGDWPLYATAYKATFIYTNQLTGLPIVRYESKGSMIGWMKFTNNLGSDPAGRELLDGGYTLDWIKVAPDAPNTNAPKYYYDSFYGNGFTNHDLQFSASVFNPVATPKTTRVLDVTNINMTFADGNLASAAAHPDGKFTNYFTWNTNNVIKWNPLQPAILNTQMVSVVLSSGKLKGLFSHPAVTSGSPKKVFLGVMLQDEVTNGVAIGRGVFAGTNGAGSFVLRKD